MLMIQWTTDNMAKIKSYLVISEQCPEGEILNAHLMYREVIKAKFKNEFITTIEVSNELKKDLNELLNELE